jgi:energy-coupling factor transporter transmembrane protein EcfT
VELAEALESRAFGSTEKRESLVTLKMNRLDYVTIVATLTLLVIVVFVSLNVTLPTPEIPIRVPDIWPWKI